MSRTANNSTSSYNADEKHAFEQWQSKKHETTDEQTLRKRKAELYALVRRVIKNELEPDQQEIVRLHWYEGKSLSEISDILGIDRSTVFRKEKKINEIIYDKLKYAVEYRFGKGAADSPFIIPKQDRAACCPADGNSISSRLRDLRLHKCITENAISRETGISTKRLGIIEKTGELITIPELQKLTLIYGTTSDYVLFGRMPKYCKGEMYYDT